MSDQEDRKERFYMKIIDIIIGLAVMVVLVIIFLQRQTNLRF